MRLASLLVPAVALSLSACVAARARQTGGMMGMAGMGGGSGGGPYCVHGAGGSALQP